MAIKKSQLYSSIWESCNNLRGSMDASQYKDYVLVLLFVKYVSDKYADDPRALIHIPEGGGFGDMVALKGQKDIGERINTIITKLAEANGLKGVIDQTDFHDETKLGKGKEMVDRLSDLIAIFERDELDFSKNRAEGDDLLGDAYEFLMRHFATESGKSKGQFYTPSEVSRIMAQVIGIQDAKSQDQTIYDPTCGSGSLLLKAVSETHVGLTIYGQEKDNQTAALAIMNMFLHDSPGAQIVQGNTISSPLFTNKDGSLKTFDYVVANPPFSDKKWTTGITPEADEFSRFDDGVPPAKNGDYAFFLHIIKSLKSTGKGAVILPHGVLFRGNAEATIRRNVIKKGYIKGIIGLPANLFYGTGIPACIVVIDKEQAQSRKGIFMIDASKGFIKDGNKNRLRDQDIHRIVDVFTKQLEIDKFSRMVPLDEIETKNDYNLNIPRYIDTQEEEDLQDIEAHLKGGIPNQDIEALERYWQVFPQLKNELFAPSDRQSYSMAKLETEKVKPQILEQPGFHAFKAEVEAKFNDWRDRHTTKLKNIGVGVKPKQLIFELGEEILATFAPVPLVDKYEVYQRLMTYWNEVMQDDAYMVGLDGWKVETYQPVDAKGKTKKGEWTCDLLPKEVVINRYFQAEKSEIEDLQAQLEEIALKKEELEEEHGGDEGAFSELDKINKGNIKAQLKEWKADGMTDDPEYQTLESYLELLDEESDVKKELKTAEANLDHALLKKYPLLTEQEIKDLVVDEKWMATMTNRVMTELDRVSQALAARVKELYERYADTLPELEKSVGDLDQKVAVHLAKMGFKI